MILSIFKVGIPVASSGVAYLYCQRPLLNDSKRNFYANNVINPAPGRPQEEDSQLAKLVEERGNAPQSALERGLEQSRLKLDQFLDGIKQAYVRQSSAYFRKEREVTDTIASLHDRRELLWPNSIYILTGFMTGLVFTRKSNVLLRATVPLACGIAAFGFFMPSTFHRTTDWFSGLEKEKIPDAYNKQAEIIRKTGVLVQKSESLKAENEKLVSRLYAKTRKTIGEITGLNVDNPVTGKKE
ncbi:DEKNAAC100365 [Brettanomyces naardenensis]|uniref:MICOS complex subunit n=1 Tax=Brettanomyces naardenensis TaxID=13370 RepID=A0A448YFW6_BRENA|nr:DEKNAAC100365 [Brettanomyces naardenensis]